MFKITIIQWENMTKETNESSFPTAYFECIDCLSIVVIYSHSSNSFIIKIIKPGARWPQGIPSFLQLLLSSNVCMHACVCPPPRLLITSGAI